MSSRSSLTAPELSTLGTLERQQRRRSDGTPTVSVLTGPVGLGMSLWRQWLHGHRRGTAQSGDSRLEGAVASWQFHVLRHFDLHWHAHRWFGEHVGMDAHEIQDKLARKTVDERKLYLEHALASWPDGAVTLLADWLLLQPPGPVRHLPWEEIVAGHPFFPVERLRAVSSLLPPDTVPGLLLLPLGKLEDAAIWLENAALTAAALARDVPALPLGIAIEAPDWFSFLTGTKETHARAVLREGVVRFFGLTEEVCREHLAKVLPQLPPEERQRLYPPLHSILQRGASAELLDAYAEAVQEHVNQAAPVFGAKEDSAARSKAEHFLHLQLEAAPPTAGLFALNQPLGFRFGNREAEGDLAATDLRLVVEIDGHWHFQDPNAYRRDRRKDLFLQQQGWLVLRFLAEDVVFRLDDVLTAIEESVAWRRAQRKETAP
jgi:hypothetical protein